MSPQQAVYVNADNSNNTSLAPVTSLVTGLVGFFIGTVRKTVELAGLIREEPDHD